MLSKSWIVARKMQQRRRSMGFSLRRLAALVGCAHTYLHQVELGVRPLSQAKAVLIEGVLRFKSGSLRLDTRRGRPTISSEGRILLRELRRFGGLPVDGRNFGKPRHARPERARGLQNPFWPMAVHLGESAHQRVKALERKWADHERFWRLANALRFDSWSEKNLVVQVGLQSVALTGVRPAGVGCLLTCVSGSSGRDVSGQAIPAFLLQYQGAAVVWFVQRCVRTWNGYRWPDNVLVVSRDGVRKTVVVEVDGPKYHRDPEAERLRDEELGVPVVHVHPELLQQEDGLQRILDRVLACLSGGRA